MQNFYIKTKFLTLNSELNNAFLFDLKRNRNNKEILDCGTYPKDYNF
jgi:hypothetical protein